MVAEARVQFMIQRVAGRGYALTQVRSTALRIGRGTNAELRSENPAVALEHAVIELDGGGYTITDRGSITGTYVNRKPVETARLAKGDIIEIGDLRIEVQLVEPGKPLFLRVLPATVRASGYETEEEEEAAAPATPGARVVRARKIDYASSYRLRRPWLTKLTLTALGLIVAFAVIGEVVRPEKQKAFMPGGLSSAHARARDAKGNAVAEQCAACHTPWKSVSNSKCMSCHPQAPHGQFEAKTPECMSCHGEHRGSTKLAAIPDSACAGCHASLERHVRLPAAQLASLRFAGGRYPFSAIAKIDSFGDLHPELVAPPDADTLRFNHKLHLAAAGLFNGAGRREVLQCTGCHALVTVRGKADPGPIAFKDHCQSCHRLTFDARFPNSEVPHGGDPGLVYGFVLATYAGDRDILSKPPAEVRRILASRRVTAPDEQAVLNADQVFKKKCTLCHEIVRRDGRFAAVAPVIRREWFPSAKFSHGSHNMMACEKCHDRVRGSVATADVLMPQREKCTECHARNATSAQAATNCVTCHEYHLHSQKRVVLASLAPVGTSGLGRGGRMLQGILLAVIVVLLLVVLVPVGFALFQRLRPAPPERPAAAARPAATPPPDRPIPPPAMPEAPVAPTGKVVPPSALPPEPAASAPVPQATMFQEVRPPESEPSGTQMVEWYGLLHCTAGPLEGQRFVVEEQGLYIGRDPSLAQIVINDSRVSKRHVRILPRDGKVWAIDQNSTNGTFLGKADGQRITEVQLKRGDTLILADNAATFTYQI